MFYAWSTEFRKTPTISSIFIKTFWNFYLSDSPFFQRMSPYSLNSYPCLFGKSHAWPLVKAILIFFNMWFQGYLCQPKLLQYANQNIWSQQDCNHGYKDPNEFNPVYKLNYNTDGSQLCANAKVHTYTKLLRLLLRFLWWCTFYVSAIVCFTRL